MGDFRDGAFRGCGRFHCCCFSDVLVWLTFWDVPTSDDFTWSRWGGRAPSFQMSRLGDTTVDYLGMQSQCEKGWSINCACGVSQYCAQVAVGIIIPIDFLTLNRGAQLTKVVSRSSRRILFCNQSAKADKKSIVAFFFLSAEYYTADVSLDLRPDDAQKHDMCRARGPVGHFDQPDTTLACHLGGACEATGKWFRKRQPKKFGRGWAAIAPGLRKRISWGLLR